MGGSGRGSATPCASSRASQTSRSWHRHARGGGTHHIHTAQGTAIRVLGNSGRNSPGKMNLGWCRDTRHILHELLHVAGMWHEQSRQDAPHYITMPRSDINDCVVKGTDSRGMKYDFRSIMHYPIASLEGTVTALGKQRLREQKTQQARVGFYSELSPLDIDNLQALYGRSTAARKRDEENSERRRGAHRRGSPSPCSACSWRSGRRICRDRSTHVRHGLCLCLLCLCLCPTGQGKAKGKAKRSDDRGVPALPRSHGWGCALHLARCRVRPLVPWAAAVFVWTFYSPLWAGPPLILKSVDRGPYYNDVLIPWASTTVTRPPRIVRARSKEGGRRGRQRLNMSDPSDRHTALQICSTHATSHCTSTTAHRGGTDCP